MLQLQKQLAFLRETDKLKSVVRNTLLLDGSRCETDAEHSWHICICAMLLREYFDSPELDFERLLKLLLVHDIVEIYAGDTYAYAEASLLDTQHAREEEAAASLFSLLPSGQAEEFRALWDEFEEKKTPEARTARGMDAFMPFYWAYMTHGKKWHELGATRDKVLERCGLIRFGSEKLYAFALEIIDEAVEKGYLPE